MSQVANPYMGTATTPWPLKPLALAAAFLLALAALLPLLLVPSPSGAPPARLSPGDGDKAGTMAALARLPMRFEANRGQTDARARYVSRGPGYTLFLTATGATLALEKRSAVSDQRSAVSDRRSAGAVVRMELVGADTGARVEGAGRLPGDANYFSGSDPNGWRSGIPTYARVRYEGVYPGVDMVYYGRGGELEYDLLLAPGADPGRVRLRFSGAEGMQLAPNGDLLLRTVAGELRQRRPYAYQEVSGARREVPSRYVLYGDRVGFALGEHDRRLPLVIDPVLAYSTYLGGNEWDAVRDVAVDATGNVYVTGETWSADFPTTPGAYDTSLGYRRSLFVAKLDATGSRLLYSTLIEPVGDRGGALGIAVDRAGNAYITGSTESYRYPTTPGAYDRYGDPGYRTQAFVTKLNATGSKLVYSTFLGSLDSRDDFAYDIALDASGNAYVVGATLSAAFPTTPGAYDRHWEAGASDGFVTKLNPTGSALVYSTYLGGVGTDSVSGIAVDGAGNAYLAGFTLATDFPTTSGARDRVLNTGGYGSDGFVTKLDASGSRLAYSTFLGGSGQDDASDIALGPYGNAYVTGRTDSANFPATSGALDRTYGGAACPVDPSRPLCSDAFVARLNAWGSILKYSTYLGGARYEEGNAIAVDAGGDAYVVGVTKSADMPTTPYAPDRTYNGGSCGTYSDGTPIPCADAFVARLDAGGARLVLSTYLGGGRDEEVYGLALGVDRDGRASGALGIYVAGGTRSSDYPTTPGAHDRTLGSFADAFVTKIR